MPDEEYTKDPKLFNYNEPQGFQGFLSSRPKWDASEKVMEGVFLAELAADRWQSAKATNQPRKYEEQNPILGKHPRESDVNTYFAAAALAHMGLAHLLPEPYRKIFQGVSIAVEAQPVINNYKAGLGIGF